MKQRKKKRMNDFNDFDEFYEITDEDYARKEQKYGNIEQVSNASEEIKKGLLEKIAEQEKRSEESTEEIEEVTESRPVNKVRTFNRKANAEMIRKVTNVTYSNAYVESNKKKIIIGIVVSVLAGIFLSVKANSYYNLKGNNDTDILPYLFGWITTDDMSVSLEPINTLLMTAGFFTGFGIIAVVCLFIYLNNDEKKQSRVGKEHGKAQLGTAKIFKTFKKKFMEM